MTGWLGLRSDLLFLPALDLIQRVPNVAAEAHTARTGSIVPPLANRGDRNAVSVRKSVRV